MSETECSLIQSTQRVHLSFRFCMYGASVIKETEGCKHYFSNLIGLLKELHANYKQKFCNKRSCIPECCFVFLMKELNITKTCKSGSGSNIT